MMGFGGQGYRSKKSDCTAIQAQDDTIYSYIYVCICMYICMYMCIYTALLLTLSVVEMKIFWGAGGDRGGAVG